MNDKGLIPQGQPACVFSQSIVDQLSLHVLTSLGLVKDSYDSSVVDKKNGYTTQSIFHLCINEISYTE